MMDILNRNKIKELENTINSLKQDLFREKNTCETYKEILKRDEWYGVHLEPGNKYFVKEDE